MATTDYPALSITSSVLTEAHFVMINMINMTIHVRIESLKYSSKLKHTSLRE